MSRTTHTVEDGTPFLVGLYFRMDIVVLAREPRDVSFPGYHQKDLLVYGTLVNFQGTGMLLRRKPLVL